MFNRLTDTESLENLFAVSLEKPIAIFKHSNTCPISSDVRDALSACPVTLFEIIVQTERSLSNLVAERTGVRHQSPQALVIFKGEVLYNASHYDIDGDDIARVMSSSTK